MDKDTAELLLLVAQSARGCELPAVWVDTSDLISLLEMLDASQAWQVVQRMAAERNAHKRSAEKALASNGKLAAELITERTRNLQLTKQLDIQGVPVQFEITNGDASWKVEKLPSWADFDAADKIVVIQDGCRVVIKGADSHSAPVAPGNYVNSAIADRREHGRDTVDGPPFTWTTEDIARLVPGSRVAVLEDGEARMCEVQSGDDTLVEFTAKSYWTCATLHCCMPKSIVAPFGQAKEQEL